MTSKRKQVLDEVNELLQILPNLEKVIEYKVSELKETYKYQISQVAKLNKNFQPTQNPKPAEFKGQNFHIWKNDGHWISRPEFESNVIDEIIEMTKKENSILRKKKKIGGKTFEISFTVNSPFNISGSIREINKKNPHHFHKNEEIETMNKEDEAKFKLLFEYMLKNPELRNSIFEEFFEQWLPVLNTNIF
jgi:hypothetical protein